MADGERVVENPHDERRPAPRQGILAWAVTCLFLGGILVAGSLMIPEQAAIVEADGAQAGGIGLALIVLALLVFSQATRLAQFMAGADSPDLVAGLKRRPYLALFAISFVILFVEVMFIRYCGSQIRIFAFYKNIPLIACFLGLGLGCFLRKGSPRHALLFLIWMVPFAAALSQGADLFDRQISELGAAASSEFILGDLLVVDQDVEPLQRLLIQFLVGSLCAMLLVAIAALFANLGRLLGTALEEVPRLPGYSVNILGSLMGILGFVAASYLQTPPWVWFLFGLLPLVAWMGSGKRVAMALTCVAMSALLVVPSRGDTVWSSYQKLVGQKVSAGYLVQISDVFYQIAIDLSPEGVARMGHNPYPHYSGVYESIERPDRVLIVGAGTGNDVAAALRAGAVQVDAVDIDPAIIAMGREHHPEKPYDDPRVRVIIDDARSAFGKLPKGTYDAVVFGVLDSHSQLGMSSVRLDNYVFTLESFTAARALLKPGGSMIVTAVERTDWMRNRFIAMLEAVCDTPVDYQWYGGPPKSFVCQVDDPGRPLAPVQAGATQMAYDDWPFLYLPERGIPAAYLLVVAMLAIASVWYLFRGGLQFGKLTPFHGHMFFLGAGFLLMEVYAINRLALLFGTTWLVSAVTIAIVLVLIVLANLTVLALGRNLRMPAYGLLALSLTLSYWIDPASVLGQGQLPALGYGLFILSPIYFAGLIFAQSFRTATVAGPALGANILGAVLGGWAEYATMATGIRSMVLLALAFYLASLGALWLSRRAGTSGPRRGLMSAGSAAARGTASAASRAGRA